VSKIKLFVFTVGKVGSSPVFDSCSLLPLYEVYHLHHLTPQAINVHKRPFENKPEGMYKHIKDVVKIIDEKVIGNEPIKVINVVRDPIARSLSHFFQNHYMPGSDKAKSPLELSKANNNEVVYERIKEAFIRCSNHQEPMQWTNSELKYIAQLNPYSKSINSKKGFGLISNGNTEILTLQCEIGDEKKLKYINKFLNSNLKTLKKSNVTSRKEIGSIYQMLKSRLNLASNFLNNIYQNEYCKHYTDKQISKY